MKFWSSLPLIVAIAFFGAAITGCEGSVEVESEPVAEETEEGAGEEEYEEDEVAAEDEEYEEEGYEAIEFTLVNDTDRPMIEFYVSPPGEELWGENLIPEEAYLDTRSEIQVIIDDSQPDCAYDIMGVFGPSEDGSVGEGELIQTDVEICDGTTYTYSQGE